jgi:hypothetical protein
MSASVVVVHLELWQGLESAARRETERLWRRKLLGERVW